MSTGVAIATRKPALLKRSRRRHDISAKLSYTSGVYFLRCGPDGPIKIGYAVWPHARAADLQSGCPYKLTLIGVIPGARELETEMHGRFIAHHIRGEWFEPCEELLALIAALPSGGR